MFAAVCENLPGWHLMQLGMSDVVVYVPAAQTKHPFGVVYNPAVQLTHLAAPSGDSVPGAHFTHEVQLATE